MSSSRSRMSRTGRRRCHAGTAAAHEMLTARVSLPPKPPPRRFVRATTLCAGKPSVCATCAWLCAGPYHDNVLCAQYTVDLKSAHSFLRSAPCVALAPAMTDRLYAEQEVCFQSAYTCFGEAPSKHVLTFYDVRLLDSR